MKFIKFDMSSWPRRHSYDVFMNGTRCVQNVTAKINANGIYDFIKTGGLRFYPVLTYVVSCAVNSRKEFKMGLDDDGNPGFYDVVHPSYNIFHKEDETVSKAYSPYSEDFDVFYSRMSDDLDKYDIMRGFEITERPKNCFDVSCLPWLNYTSVDMHVFDDASYLPPVIIWGKIAEENGAKFLPLTIQIHHAAADGFHLSMFFKDVEKAIETLIKKRKS